MKIHQFDFALWPFLLHLITALGTSSPQDTNKQNAETGNPLYLIIYEKYDTVTFVDADWIANQTFSSIHKPSRIVPLCPIDENQDAKFGILNTVDVDTFGRKGKIVCHRNFKPSIKQSDSYEIGYRIHVDHDGVLGDNYFISEMDKDGEKPDDYWDSFYELDFDHDSIRTEVVRHVVLAKMHSNDYTSQCFDYNFGRDILGKVDITQFYKQDHQENLFKIWNIPTPSPYGYLVMHQFAPIQDDTNDVIRSGLCTHLNTVPLWQHVSEYSVRKVEEFIRKVVDVVGHINVMTGAPVSESTDFYLDPSSSTIPIPRIIAKTLIYIVNSSNSDQIIHIINIFIHNEPTSQIKRTICQVSVCEQYGWNFDIGDVDIGYTYCCLEYNPNYPPDLQAHHGLKWNLKPFNLNQQLMKLDYKMYKSVNVVEILKLPEEEREDAILQSANTPEL